MSHQKWWYEDLWGWHWQKWHHPHTQATHLQCSQKPVEGHQFCRPWAVQGEECLWVWYQLYHHVFEQVMLNLGNLDESSQSLAVNQVFKNATTKLMDGWIKVSSVWRVQPPASTLSIVVKVPSAGEQKSVSANGTSLITIIFSCFSCLVSGKHCPHWWRHNSKQLPCWGSFISFSPWISKCHSCWACEGWFSQQQLWGWLGGFTDARDTNSGWAAENGSRCPSQTGAYPERAFKQTSIWIFLSAESRCGSFHHLVTFNPECISFIRSTQ